MSEDPRQVQAELTANSAGPAEVEAAVPPDVLPAGKSPLFEAYNAARYHRQRLIRQINESSGRHLLCLIGGGDAPLEREDVLAFADLLYGVPEGAHIDLMLQTVGGDTDVTEKLAGMLWARIGKTGTLRVIVPDYAKSAGTLLALAADEIVMSDTSELGPIDPQVVRRRPNGIMTISVQHHLDAHKRAKQALIDDPDDPVALAEFSTFDPATIVAYYAVVARAQALSDKHLKRGMFRRGEAGPYTAISHKLLDTTRWRTHGQVIDPREAKEIGLNIDYRSQDDPEWQAWWRLHCLQRLALENDTCRIFESDPVFLPY